MTTEALRELATSTRVCDTNKITADTSQAFMATTARPPSFRIALESAESGDKNMSKCPNCNSSEYVVLVSTWRKTGTAVGAEAGGVAGYAGANAGAAAGASTGALVGSVLPGVGTAIGAGIGALAGSILGALGGGAAGAKVGNAAGHQIDKMMGTYVCHRCGKQFDADVG